jgi:hypothetical protein
MRVLLALALFVLTSCAPAIPPALPLAEPIPASAASYTWHPFRWSPGATFLFDYRQLMEVTLQGRPDRHVFNARITMTVSEPTAAGLTRLEVAVNGTRVAEAYLGADGLPRDAALVVKATDVDHAVLKSAVHGWQHPALKHFAMQPFTVNEPRRLLLSFAEVFGEAAPVRFTPDVTLPVVLTFTGEKRVLGRRAHEVRSATQLPRGHGTLAAGDSKGQTADVAGSFDAIQYFDAETGFPIAAYNVNVLEIYTPVRATLRETSSIAIAAH